MKCRINLFKHVKGYKYIYITVGILILTSGIIYGYNTIIYGSSINLSNKKISPVFFQNFCFLFEIFQVVPENIYIYIFFFIFRSHIERQATPFCPAFFCCSYSLEVMTTGQSKKVEEKIFGEESIKIIELG